MKYNAELTPLTALTAPPVHGGDIEYSQKQYPEVLLPWLDLSAGLNPLPWLIPDTIPQSVFQRLPDSYSALLHCAAEYYQQESLWPVNGSQQAIEWLPELRNGSVVAVPEYGYQEHAWCWKKKGHQVFGYRHQDLTGDHFESLLQQVDVLVVINPNNPTGQRVLAERLQACYQYLEQKNGWLIVDEAFIDVLSAEEQQALSLASEPVSDGLWVLRSLGKYSGLAGIRSGFVLSSEANLEKIRLKSGPWHMSGVTAWLTEQFLKDQCWRQNNRDERLILYRRQRSLLERYFSILGETPLFITVTTVQPEQVQHQLADSGIRVRAFPEAGWLRFGLVGQGIELKRLQSALEQIDLSDLQACI